MTGRTAEICIIAALSENRVIGRDGGLPWHLPEDLKHFKRLTLGKPLIMGRKTFESIGSKPLPGRLNIVVSRKDFSAGGVVSAGTIEEALARAQERAARDGVTEIMIAGGAQIYKAALPLTDRLYLTIVHKTVSGDTFFPELCESEWNETARDGHGEYSFITMVREKI